MRRFDSSSTGGVKVAVAALLGALCAAPYFPGCLPSHGAYPTACTGAGCPPARTTASYAQVEARLGEAQATSVVHIGRVGSWNELEPCDPTLAAAQLRAPPGTQFFYQEPPQGSPPNTPNVYCWPDLTWLREHLRALVAHQSSTNPSCTGGRVGIINVAPIFSEQNALPDYLAYLPLSNPHVAQRYAQLMAAVIAELNDPAYQLAADDRASWYLLIGNEIDMYLNDTLAPYPKKGPSANLSAYQRWQDFRTFYGTAVYLIRSGLPQGLPVSIGTTVRWGTEGTAPNIDGVCGPYELWARASQTVPPPAPCNYLTVRNQASVWATVPVDQFQGIALTHLQLAAVSDLFVYTRYYPRYLGLPPGTVAKDYYRTLVTQELQQDFADMASWSAVGTYLQQTTSNLPIVIQEISQPSAYHVGGSGLTVEQSLAAHGIAEQQESLVRAAYQAYRAHNDSEPLAPLLSVNWFNLHDFANVNHPLSPCNTTATSGWLSPACSWGLLTPTGAAKASGPLQSCWSWFAAEGVAQNAPELGIDPPRACAAQ